MIASQDCQHTRVAITAVSPCCPRGGHKGRRRCAQEDVSALCLDCRASLVAFGWYAFDRREWSRVNGTLTAAGLAWLERGAAQAWTPDETHVERGRQAL